MTDISIKSESEMRAMRTSCRILAEIMRELLPMVRPGVTTKYLDDQAAALMAGRKVKPGFKGYRGYPAVICTSVNEEVVHVIPGDRVLQEGDVLTIDAGVIYDGFNSDMAVTVPVGKVSKEVERLIAVTKESLARGIDQAVVGARVGAISNAIQTYVESQGFGVVRDLVGHGIGRVLHEDPPVPNYGPVNAGALLQEGMTIAIEPMVTVGSFEISIDDWRVTTKDGSLAAHFEHTIAITETGPEVLTRME